MTAASPHGPPPALEDRLERLEFQAGTILYLSAANMLMNVLTILAGFWIGLS
jgi:hypothetical protein